MGHNDQENYSVMLTVYRKLVKLYMVISLQMDSGEKELTSVLRLVDWVLPVP